MRNSVLWAVLFLNFIGFLAFGAQNSLTTTYAKITRSDLDLKLQYSHTSYFAENTDSAMDIELRPSYTLNRQYSLGMDAEYIRPYNKYSDDKTSGFEDTIVYWSDKNKLGGGYILGFMIRGILPSSTTSQRAGLQWGTSGEVNLKKEFLFGSIFIGTELIRYFHQFYTANDAGTEYNAPWAMWNKLSVNLKIYGPLSWFYYAAFYTYRDYAEFFDTVFRFESAMTYYVSKGFDVSLTFRRIDKIITNNSLFDRYNTAVLFGLSLFI